VEKITVGKSTSRIIVCRCPRCYETLQIHVRGIPQTMSPKEFLAQLAEDDLDFIHHMHVEESSSMISMSRTRTRPITANPPPRARTPTMPPRTKTPTKPVAGRTTTRQRMKPLTKP
jgi:hypothetical protein